MATISTVVKDGHHLIITYSDGSVVQRSIVWDDTVTSVPPDGHFEIGNITVNGSNLLVINYNGNSITIDPSGTGTVGTSGTPVANDIARFTDATTIEGRSYSEVKGDLSLDNVENTAHSTDAHTMTIDGRDVSVDGTKLDGIESNATADQTGAEMVTALEALSPGSQLSHDQLDDVSTSDHHTKYTDADAVTAGAAQALAFALSS